MYTHGLVEYLGTSLLIGAVAFTTNPLFVVAALAIAIGLGGKISGGHFNPAVSFGLWASGRFDIKDLVPYILAQCIGALAAGSTLLFILSGKEGFAIDNSKAGVFASNGYGAFSPDGYSMNAAFIAEFVLTMFFLIIILGATDKLANGKFAGIAIGLALTLIHLVSIPITNTSVNPARSTSQALLAQGEPLSQLWLFWAAPVAGAIAGGIIYKMLLEKLEL